MVSIFKGKKRARLLALVAAVAFLLSGAVSFIQPVTALADSGIVCLTGKVGEPYHGGPWKYGPQHSQEDNAKDDFNLEIVGNISGLPEGVSARTLYETHDHGWAIVFEGTPKKTGTYTFSVELELKRVTSNNGHNYDKWDSQPSWKYNDTYTIKIEEADKDEDDDDDDSSSSSVSEEERQAEAAKHFAPDTASMTPEQSAGWSLVSREAPSVSSSSGGVTATSAYQGPVCRLGFQLAAPGYSVGHTYNMSFTGAGGSTSMKVLADLVKSGRKFVISFVYGGGVYVSTPVLTPDANGNISFNPALLGLGPNSNAAIAIMYQD